MTIASETETSPKQANSPLFIYKNLVSNKDLNQGLDLTPGAKLLQTAFKFPVLNFYERWLQ